MGGGGRAAAATLVAALLAQPAAGSWYVPGVSPREYAEGELVEIFANSLTSTQGLFPYGFYSIKQCAPDGGTLAAGQHGATLGEVLWGDQIEPSLYEAAMKTEVQCRILCAPMKLGDAFSAADRETLLRRVEARYRGNLVVDNLPVAMEHPLASTTSAHIPLSIGYPLGVPAKFAEDHKAKLYNHLALTIKYHKPDIVQDKESWRIVGFSVVPHSVDHAAPADCQPTMQFSPETIPALSIETADTLTWSYSVTWVEDEATVWATRWDSILRAADSEENTHWFSIVNSSLVVLFLSALLAFILLRAVRRDFIRYSLHPEEEVDAIKEETGWKLCHGDVFRVPKRASLLAVLVGTGSQLLCTSFIVLVFALFGFLSPANRGSLLNALLLMFYLGAGHAGYVTARLIKLFKAQSWLTIAGLGGLFPGYCFAVYFCLNLLQWQKNATTAIPFVTLLALVCFWGGIALLCCLGAVVGFKRDVETLPCHVTTVPRHIPPQPTYMSTPLVSLVAGLLPFGAAYIELAFIMGSLWQGRVYYVFGFLALVFLILAVTCAEISIVTVYFQLTGEDYHWWWRAFAAPAASAAYVWLYSVWYYSRVLSIHNFSASVLYFGYMSIVCVYFALTTGTLGFLATFKFVKVIYSHVKID